MARVAVLGAGVSGAYAAWKLAAAGHQVSLYDQQSHIGGLASSFQQDGRYYPLGYHQILSTDTFLHQVLTELGLWPRVRQQKVKMLFWYNGRAYDFGNPSDVLRFPLPLMAKLGLARLAAVARLRSNWDKLSQVDAASWLDRTCGPTARRALFEPLIFTKFGLEAREVSAAWLGGRLHGKEASGNFGYIPEADWTKLLAEGLTHQCQSHGVEMCLGRGIRSIEVANGKIVGVTDASGNSIGADVYVSSLPLPVLSSLLPRGVGDELRGISYTGVISCVAELKDEPPVDCYWLNMIQPRVSFGGLFTLTNLNSTLGRPGKKVVNFVTHCGQADQHPLFKQEADAIYATYAADYESAFERPLRTAWHHVSKLRFYSPRFVVGYRNPSITVDGATNLYLCGHYRTYPELTSTGTAMASAHELVKYLQQTGL
jgi:protoporphyrinogen oxidase